MPTYSAFGGTLDSEIEFPELQSVPSDRTPRLAAAGLVPHRIHTQPATSMSAGSYLAKTM